MHGSSQHPLFVPLDKTLVNPHMQVSPEGRFASGVGSLTCAGIAMASWLLGTFPKPGGRRELCLCESAEAWDMFPKTKAGAAGWSPL
jgi:hypothetical protein